MSVSLPILPNPTPSLGAPSSTLAGENAALLGGEPVSDNGFQAFMPGTPVVAQNAVQSPSVADASLSKGVADSSVLTPNSQADSSAAVAETTVVFAGPAIFSRLSEAGTESLKTPAQSSVLPGVDSAEIPAADAEPVQVGSKQKRSNTEQDEAKSPVALPPGAEALQLSQAVQAVQPPQVSQESGAAEPAKVAASLSSSPKVTEQSKVPEQAKAEAAASSVPVVTPNTVTDKARAASQTKTDKPQASVVAPQAQGSNLVTARELSPGRTELPLGAAKEAVETAQLTAAPTEYRLSGDSTKTGTSQPMTTDAAPAVVSVRDARQISFRPATASNSLPTTTPAKETPAGQVPLNAEPAATVAIPVSIPAQAQDLSAVQGADSTQAKSGTVAELGLPRENSAASTLTQRGSLSSKLAGTGKNSTQISGQQLDKKQQVSVGTATAEKGDAMFSEESKSTLGLEPSKENHLGTLGVDRVQRTGQELNPAQVGHESSSRERVGEAPGEAALRAVEAVRDVTEKLQAQPQRVIHFNLNLDGGEKLGVSIDFRNGDLKTTFRTDSSELREAISREWQTSMTATLQGVEGVRMGDPVFANSQDARSESGLANSDGQASRQQNQQNQQAQQQQQQDYRQAASHSSTLFTQRSGRTQDAGAANQAPSHHEPTAKDGNSQRLHAFA